MTLTMNDEHIKLMNFGWLYIFVIFMIWSGFFVGLQLTRCLNNFILGLIAFFTNVVIVCVLIKDIKRLKRKEMLND